MEKSKQLEPVPYTAYPRDESITDEQMIKRITAYYASSGKYCLTCFGAGRAAEQREETVLRRARDRGLSKLRGRLPEHGEPMQVKRWWSVICPECEGAKETAETAYARRLRATQAPPNLIESCTFERFDSKRSQKSASAFRHVRAWAERPAGSLVLVGAKGSGKTHLAIAALRVLAWHGLVVRFGQLRDDIFMDLKRSMDEGNYDDVWRWWVEQPDVLIIDDYGTKQDTDWQNTAAEQMVTWRYARERLFIVTADVGPEAVSERVYSRWNDKSQVSIINCGDMDYRRLLKPQATLTEGAR